jgi:nitrogen regulatory protein PII
MTKYEFIKYGDKYIVKNSNGRIVSEKEKIQMENKELILKDITGCGCQKETTKKLSANKKRLKEIEKKEKIENYIKEKVKDDADDIIQETTETI